MNARTTLVASLAGLALAGLGSAASAAVMPVNWLNYSPTAFGNTPANNALYNLPGLGLVNVSYTNDPVFTTARLDQTALLGNGSVTSGPDTYTWGNYESFARTHTQPTPLNMSWTITYTFPSTVSAGQIVLGVSGLGRRDPLPGESAAACITTATVLQNGTYFGDFSNGGNYGPTQFTPAAGTFSMTNSVTGAGGADPWWNTPLAIVRINDAMSSLTVHFDQTAGDGVGVNIGYVVPAPGAGATLACAGMLLSRRRRSA